MVSIGPRIGVRGEGEFRAAFREMTAQARLLNAEMEKLTTTFSHNDSAMTRTAKVSEQLTRQIQTQEQTLKAADRAKDQAIIREKEQHEALKRTKERQIELTNAYTKAKTKLEALKNEYGETHPYVQGATAATEKLREELNQNTKDLEKSHTAWIRSREAVDEWTRRVVEAETELAKKKQELEKMPHTLEIFGGALQKAGGYIQAFGDGLTKYVTTPLLTMGAYAVKSASDVTDGMAKIYTIAKDSQLPMSQMRDQLISLSNETGFAMDDLAEAAYQSVSASVDTEKAASFMADAANLARAGFTSTTRAVDLLTTVINAYGMEAEDAAYISDVLLKTQNDGKTIIDELAGSMGTVIPTAANYNISLEQLAGAYATMTKQGVNTARATTFMNAMFTELEKEGKGVSLILEEETGKSFAQLMGEGKSLAEVLKILYDYVGNDNEEFQKLFGNIRSGKAAAALVRDDFKVLTEEVERMGKATGQTEYALRVLETPSLKARRAINRLKNTATDLGQVMLDRMIPTLEKVVGAVEKGTEWFKNLDDVTKNYIINIGLAAISAGPLIKVFGTILTVGGKVVSSFGLIAKSVKTAGGLLGGLKLAAAGEAGLGAIAPAAGAAALAIAGVATAVAYLNEKHEASVRATYAMTEEEKKLIDTSQLLAERQQAVTAETDTERQAIDETAETARTLKDRYNELVDENGNIKEGSEELAKTIKGELAEALGIEYGDLENLIDQNGKLGKSIDEIIQKQKRQALMEAYKDDYVQALKRQAEQQKIVDDLDSTISTKEEERDKQLRRIARIRELFYTDAIGAAQSAGALQDASIALAQLNEDLDSLYKERDTQLPLLDDTNALIKNYENLTSITDESVAEMTLNNQKLVMGFLDAEHGSKESLGRQVQNIKAGLDDARKKFEKGGYGVTKENVEMWEQLLEDAQTEEAKYFYNLRQTGEKTPDEIAKGLTASKDKMKTSIQKFGDDGLVKALEPVARRAGENAGEATATGIPTGMYRKMDYVRTESGRLIKDEVLKGVQPGIKEMENAGWNYAQGLINGMNRYPIKNSVREWAGHVPTQTRATLHEKSPSKLSEEYGMYWGMGLINGMLGTEGSVSAAAASLANGITGAYPMMNSYSPNTLGYGLGGSTSSKTITAPISVNVTVNGNVDNYDELAETIADKINEQIIRKNEVFA